jgi:hypothetical protein
MRRRTGGGYNNTTSYPLLVAGYPSFCFRRLVPFRDLFVKLQSDTAKMVYFGLRGRPLGVLVSLVSATAFMLQGYDQAVMNGLVTLPTFITVFPEMKNSNIEGNIQTLCYYLETCSLLLGTTVAIYEIGCAIGALSCAFIGDVLGRRRMLFTAGVVVIIGVILQATPFSLPQLIVARIITGMLATRPSVVQPPTKEFPSRSWCRCNHGYGAHVCV